MVAITGYYAAWRVGTGWREIRSSPWSHTPDVLRLCCDAARGEKRSDDGVETLPAKNYRAQPDVLRSRVRDELGGVGLWDRHGRRLKTDPESVGIVMSSSKGFWPQRLQEPFFDVVDWLCCDGAARSVARWLGTQGPVLSPVAACATGAHSIALGANWIEDGRCDVVIAGAVERPIEPLIQAGYQQLGAVSHDVMRPFDKARDGFVPNTGMGFLVLENAEKARARGVGTHAYLSGHALCSDNGDALNMENDGASIVRAIESALKRAQVLAETVDYVNVHGTATQHNDQIEARALRTVFGFDAKKSPASTCKASATKPLTGHLLGASGAVEAVLCVQALREGFVPPTLNLHDLDEDCAFNWTTGTGEPCDIERALSLSYGFGGHVAALLFEK